MLKTNYSELLLAYSHGFGSSDVYFGTLVEMKRWAYRDR